MKTYEKLFSEAYDIYTYPDAVPTIDVGGAVGVVSAEPIKPGNVGAMARGLAETELSLPGEIEGLINGLVNLYENPEGKKRLDAFLEGLAKDTKLPRLEKVQELLDKYLPEVSEEFEIDRTMGQVAAPGAAIGIAGKAVSKGRKSAPVVAPAIVAPKVEVKQKANK
jgi:hypothetical protein